MFRNVPKITIQGSVISISDGTSPLERKPGKRGKIKNFSRQSQNRLLRFLGRIVKEFVVFITLTAKDDPSHDDLRHFIKLLYRRYGEFPIIWKKEYQKRGTVHYHLCLITRRWIDKLWIIQAWRKAINADYDPSVRVNYRESGRVMAYLAKYVSKGVGVNGSLELSNITGQEYSGRFWGCEGRKYIKYHNVEVKQWSELTLEETSKIRKVVEYILNKTRDITSVTIVSFEREFCKVVDIS